MKHATFAIIKMAAEASQAASCRSTMGPKMAAKLEADNDSGPHTTEADYEEQDVRKVFRFAGAPSRTGRNHRSHIDMIQPKRKSKSYIWSQREPLRRAARKSRTLARGGTWRRSCPLALALLASALVLIGALQTAAESGEQIATNQVILSTGEY